MNTIQLKYDVGDTVFFMLGNKVRIGTVRHIQVQVTEDEPLHIKYSVEVDELPRRGAASHMDFLEDALFPNKQELLNSL